MAIVHVCAREMRKRIDSFFAFLYLTQIGKLRECKSSINVIRGECKRINEYEKERTKGKKREHKKKSLSEIVRVRILHSIVSNNEKRRDSPLDQLS